MIMIWIPPQKKNDWSFFWPLLKFESNVTMDHTKKCSFGTSRFFKHHLGGNSFILVWLFKLITTSFAEQCIPFVEVTQSHLLGDQSFEASTDEMLGPNMTSYTSCLSPWLVVKQLCHVFGKWGIHGYTNQNDPTWILNREHEYKLLDFRIPYFQRNPEKSWPHNGRLDLQDRSNHHPISQIWLKHWNILRINKTITLW